MFCVFKLPCQINISLVRSLAAKPHTFSRGEGGCPKGRRKWNGDIQRTGRSLYRCKNQHFRPHSSSAPVHALGHLPPGGGFRDCAATAPQIAIYDIHKHAPPGSAEHVLIDLQVHHPAGGMGFQSGGEQLVAALRLVGTEAAEAAGQSTQLTDKGGKHL